MAYVGEPKTAQQRAQDAEMIGHIASRGAEIDRLRAEVQQWQDTAKLWEKHNAELCGQIESLCKEVNHQSDSRDGWKEIAANADRAEIQARDEAERLRAENERLRRLMAESASLRDEIGQWMERHSALRAENERLREALRITRDRIKSVVDAGVIAAFPEHMDAQFELTEIIPNIDDALTPSEE